jgi:hypothetical protein
MVLTSNRLLLANKLLCYVSKSESGLQEFTILKYIPTFNPELEMVKMMIIFEITVSTVSNKNDNKFPIMTQKLNQSSNNNIYNNNNNFPFEICKLKRRQT